MKCAIILLVVTGMAQEYHIKTVDLNDAKSNNTRIIGGTPANIEKYPFAVQLQYYSNTVCGGSLITQRHVLTAAHCFFDRNGNMVNINAYTVRVGTSYLHSGGVVHGVSAVIPHENYDTPPQDNDVAVMVLSSSVTFNSRVGVASLPEAGDELPDNTTVWHIGWGTTVSGGEYMSAVLNEVEVYTVSHEVCAARYRLLALLQAAEYAVTDNMLCSGILDVGGKDACQGDSGGPLLYNGVVVVGVTSWGYKCAEPRFPGVNAKVSRYTDWINRTITRYNSSPQVGSEIRVLLLITSVIYYLIQ